MWLLVCLVVAVYGAATLSSGRLPTPARLGFAGSGDGGGENPERSVTADWADRN